MQNISVRFRQDEFKGESAKAVQEVREHRRDLQNSLVSSLMKYSVLMS
ncbi:MAG TPA: palindromic element RPE3 domain-containing protein [Rickettsia endosymbiont of Pyrocoelia pectoralis]|nr:palindromic element RPE3 domain-containing protein [Rickettsia endosymbiont of Pyrocoelia pectoralis]